MSKSGSQSTEAGSPHSATRLILAVLALLGSGAAALVFEVVWMRRLELVIGNTTQAAATTATLFMLGLGLGAWWAGRRVGLRGRPWLAYVVFEAGVALWALLSLVLLPLLLRMAPALAQTFVDDVLFVPLSIRLLVALVVLLPPAFLMGATLPFLVAATGISGRELDAKGGLLYGANTIGACLGAVLAGFLLIPNLGLGGALLIGLLLSVAACLFAGLGHFMTANASPTLETHQADESTMAPVDQSTPAKWPMLLLAAFAGFLALWLQVLWYRSLALVSGTSVYAVATVLGVTLAGMGLGPLLLGWPSRALSRWGGRWLPLALLLSMSGLAVLFGTARFGSAPLRFLSELKPGMSWSEMFAIKRNAALALIFPVSLLLSPVLPLVARRLADTMKDPAQAFSRALVANTVGALAGGLLGGFLLLPWLGLQKGFLVAGLLLGCVGLLTAMAALRGPARFFSTTTMALVTVVAALFAWKPWDKSTFALGAWFAPGTHGGEEQFQRALETTRLLHYQEGIGATTAVLEDHQGRRRYLSDGKVEAGTDFRGMINQRFAGHLPMLFHPGEPRQVLNIGLGAGTSAGALATHSGPARVTVLELERSVEAATRLFAQYNGNLLEDPRLELVFADARNHLLASQRQYDVVASDPFEPVVAGAMQLFTVEHYRQLRARLAPGGVVGQWIPMYEMSSKDYRDLLTTFLEVFPDSLFFSTGMDSLLVGFTGDQRADRVRMEQRFAEPKVRASFAELGFENLDEVLGLMVIDFRDSPMEQWLERGEVVGDAHPRVEFSAPRHVFGGEIAANRRVQIELFRKSLGDPVDTAPALQERRAVAAALEAGWHLNNGRVAEALAGADEAMVLSPSHPLVRDECGEIYEALGTVALRQGDLAGASRSYRAARSARPDHFQTLHALAQIALQEGDLGTATALVADGRRRFPKSPYFEMLQAALLAIHKRFEEAVLSCETAIARAPDMEAAWEQYRRIVEKSGDPRLRQRYQQLGGR